MSTKSTAKSQSWPHIAFDACGLTPGQVCDGNAMVISSLAEALYQLRIDCQFGLKFFTLNSDVLRNIPNQFLKRVLGVGLGIPAHRLVRYALPIELAFLRPDVMINVAGSFQPLHVPCRQMSIVHDIAFELDEWKAYYTDELREYLSVNTARAMRRANGIVAVSSCTKNDVVDFYGVAPDKIKVIYNGFDKARFNPNSTERTGEISRRIGERPYFVSVGTIQPRKNYIRLIDAFVSLKREMNFPHCLIIVGGKGWLSEETVRFAERFADFDVCLWGKAADEDLPALYQNAFAMVMPALYEGFGIPVVEAMACGIPVIGSKTGSLQEVIGEFGIQFSPYSVSDIAQSMKLLLSNHDLCLGLREKSLRRAECFGWDHAAREYLDFAREIGEA